jgi:hypothetical protein
LMHFAVLFGGGTERNTLCAFINRHWRIEKSLRPVNDSTCLGIFGVGEPILETGKEDRSKPTCGDIDGHSRKGGAFDQQRSWGLCRSAMMHMQVTRTITTGCNVQVSDVDAWPFARIEESS